MRAEGKGYVVKDGDVLHFLFNTWRRRGRVVEGAPLLRE
jgi:hypothetical protein